MECEEVEEVEGRVQGVHEGQEAATKVQEVHVRSQEVQDVHETGSLQEEPGAPTGSQNLHMPIGQDVSVMVSNSSLKTRTVCANKPGGTKKFGNGANYSKMFYSDL